MFKKKQSYFCVSLWFSVRSTGNGKSLELHLWQTWCSSNRHLCWVFFFFFYKKIDLGTLHWYHNTILWGTPWGPIRYQRLFHSRSPFNHGFVYIVLIINDNWMNYKCIYIFYIVALLVHLFHEETQMYFMWQNKMWPVFRLLRTTNLIFSLQMSTRECGTL